MIDAQTLTKELSKEFGKAARAITVKADFTFNVMIDPAFEEDGKTFISLFPSPEKEFRLEVTDLEKQETQWVLVTPKERWLLRKLAPDVLKDYSSYMKKVGY